MTAFAGFTMLPYISPRCKGSAALGAPTFLITYSRGVVKINSRKNLEVASCESYAALTEQIKKWRTDAFSIGHSRSDRRQSFIE